MTPLASALQRVQAIIEKKEGVHILQTKEILRKDRELLLKTGWLEEIIKGWYMVVRPDVQKGESTAWFACFWDFVRLYLENLYGKNYCLSAECSLDLLIGSNIIPTQLTVISKRGSGIPIKLPHQSSLLVYSDPERIPEETINMRGLQVMPLPLALCRATPTFFSRTPKNAEIALRSIRDPGEIIRAILQNNAKSAAARIIGAYQFLEETKQAAAISDGLAEVGLFVNAENPFKIENPLLGKENGDSIIANKIYALWQGYRNEVIAYFPKAPGLPLRKEKYLKQINEIYTQDAYNSLSIEGYAVTKALVERVAKEEWNPDLSPSDANLRNALAARGYYEAFQSVKKSVDEILQKANPGKVIKDDLAGWYQKLFGASARAGLIPVTDLYGYRRNQVFIRNSRHTPVERERLMDAMDAYFKCLENEEHPAVRAVLGHFVFVYIHPYMDGNGRLGRFIMNAMLASGGYSWTVIPVDERKTYFAALEEGSLEKSIVPFTQFVAEQMKATSA